MNFTTELSIAEEIELTDSELKAATGGWGGVPEQWELIWTPYGPVWELVPIYWGGGDRDHYWNRWDRDRRDHGDHGDHGDNDHHPHR